MVFTGRSRACMLRIYWYLLVGLGPVCREFTGIYWLVQNLYVENLLVGPGLVCQEFTVFVLGQDKGYTVKYNPLPEGVPEGKTRGNS